MSAEAEGRVANRSLERCGFAALPEGCDRSPPGGAARGLSPDCLCSVAGIWSRNALARNRTSGAFLTFNSSCQARILLFLRIFNISFWLNPEIYRQLSPDSYKIVGIL
jgi:hypothetical protein